MGAPFPKLRAAPRSHAPAFPAGADDAMGTGAGAHQLAHAHVATGTAGLPSDPRGQFGITAHVRGRA